MKQAPNKQHARTAKVDRNLMNRNFNRNLRNQVKFNHEHNRNQFESHFGKWGKPPATLPVNRLEGDNRESNIGESDIGESDIGDRTE